jgi:hypothetical protein
VFGGVRIWQQRGQGVRQVLGLSRGGGDREHEPRLTLVVPIPTCLTGAGLGCAAHGGQRGDKNGAKGRWCDELGVAGARLAHVLKCVPKLRILSDGAEEA